MRILIHKWEKTFNITFQLLYAHTYTLSFEDWFREKDLWHLAQFLIIIILVYFAALCLPNQWCLDAPNICMALKFPLQSIGFPSYILIKKLI